MTHKKLGRPRKSISDKFVSLPHTKQPPDLIRECSEAARRAGVPFSKFVRDALMEHLRRVNRQARKNAYESEK